MWQGWHCKYILLGTGALLFKALSYVAFLLTRGDRLSWPKTHSGHISAGACSCPRFFAESFPNRRWRKWSHQGHILQLGSAPVQTERFTVMACASIVPGGYKGSVILL